MNKEFMEWLDAEIAKAKERYFKYEETYPEAATRFESRKIALEEVKLKLQEQKQ